jgi:hypothetical protein
MSVDREVIESVPCPGCRRSYPFVTAFIRGEGDASAIAYVACHIHFAAPTAWIDVTFGSWHDPSADHVTFSAQVTASAVVLVQAPVATKGDGRLFGVKLGREEARDHTSLDDFWEIVELIVTANDCVVQHLNRFGYEV